MMVGPNWEALRTAGQMAIGVAVATLGFVAGARLIRLDDPATRRLASFMWLIGTGGVALTLGALVDAIAFDEPGWNFLIIGLPVCALGAVLWRNRDRPLQVLTTAIGAGLALGGVGALLAIPPWVGGIIVWTIAARDRIAGHRPGAATRGVRARGRRRRRDDRRHDARRRQRVDRRDRCDDHRRRHRRRGVGTSRRADSRDRCDRVPAGAPRLVDDHPERRAGGRSGRHRRSRRGDRRDRPLDPRAETASVGSTRRTSSVQA